MKRTQDASIAVEINLLTVAIGETLHLPARNAFGLVDLGAFSCQDHVVGSLRSNVDEFNGLAVSPETL